MFPVETDQKTHQWKNTIKLIVMTRNSDLMKVVRFDKHTYHASSCYTMLLLKQYIVL